ncbi:chorismate-binding protein [Chitinasiproducens palmae]|nr:chorismate-binding protein [Chitinasiproducens palmae]
MTTRDALHVPYPASASSLDARTAHAAGRFVLLDDAGADAGVPRSRLYRGFRCELCAPQHGSMDDFDNAVDAALRAGQHAVVLADYEWGVQRALPGGQAPAHGGGDLRVWLFETCEHLDADAVSGWLRDCDRRVSAPDDLPDADSASQGSAPSVAGLLDCRADVSYEAFEHAMSAIREALEAGECYQINYTFRLHFATFGSPFGLYLRLRARQPAAYGALIGTLPGTGDEAAVGGSSGRPARWLMSFSPELFVRHVSGILLAQPMKGTAARGATPDADRAASDGLARCAKNRAENVMIVDLLRNDLGRVARTGSVRVPALFETQALPTVWQMTSTVEAALPPARGFAEVMTALFPCGSITGAPKRRAMALIDTLEASPRGLYTGAIGWLEAPADGRRCGDFCLSVAIRTLALEAPGAIVNAPLADARARPGRMGVGAGIVLDSEAGDEWRECLLKGRFLSGVAPGFALFETLALIDGTIRHRERHLARLGEAARRLGFVCDLAAVNAQIDAACASVARGTVHRLRVELAHDGGLTVRSGALAPLPGHPVDVFLAPDAFGTVPGDDPLLRFKTTRRARYDRAWQAAETQGGFDMLFRNARGDVTEGGRSNLFARIGGRWFTPPVADGLLPGVMRAVLLADPAWQASERSLSPDDLANAEALLVCNALRGAVPARLRPWPGVGGGSSLAP